MKLKLFMILTLLTPLIGYLEWGGNQHTFLLFTEWQVIRGLLTNSESVIHPLTVLPLLGQLIILYTILVNNFPAWLLYTGIILIALLLVFMLFIGIISLNFKISLSVIPFIISSILTIYHYRKLNT